jgi:hypothetical protein
LMTLEELGSKLQEVDDARRLAHTELEALTRRQEHIEQLENNVESLLKLMAERVPDALEGLIPNPVVEYTYAKRFVTPHDTPALTLVATVVK